MICDEAGFLLDDKALKVIESVPVNEQGYVKAEEVVQALGIRDASAFEALIEAIVMDEEGEVTVPVQTDGISHRPSGQCSLGNLQTCDLSCRQRDVCPGSIQ